MRLVFINLPVKSAAAARDFFAALGFAHNPQFSSDTNACVVVSETIYLMLLEHSRFKEFATLPIADAKAATGLINALSCDSRAEVEDLTAKALAAGATTYRPAQDHGFMYGTAIQDPDGHVWEFFWMDPTHVQ